MKSLTEMTNAELADAALKTEKEVIDLITNCERRHDEFEKVSVQVIE